MITRTLCIAILIFTTAVTAPAQTPVLLDDDRFQSDAQRAISTLYNAQPETAREIMREWHRDFPAHPIWMVWDAMEIWWVVLNDLEDRSHDDALLETLARADYQAGRLLQQEPGHPDGLLIRAIANGYMARHHANREEWVTAVRLGKRAYDLYQTLSASRPGFPDNHFTEGMSLYYADYLPDAYPVLRPFRWLMPHGDRQDGLQRLETAKQNAIFSGAEATYFLGIIHINYENDSPAGLRYLQELANRFPDNAYYQRLYVRALTMAGRVQEIDRVVPKILERWEREQLAHAVTLQEELYLFHGIALHRQGRWPEALEAFRMSQQASLQLPNDETRQTYNVSSFHYGRTAMQMHQPDLAREKLRVAANQRSDTALRNRARELLRSL
ncbi:MAG: tetratricopeptide repeat protein [Balneolaceae bacterium]